MYSTSSSCQGHGVSTARQELNSSGQAERVVEFDTVSLSSEVQEPDGRFLRHIVSVL